MSSWLSIHLTLLAAQGTVASCAMADAHRSLVSQLLRGWFALFRVCRTGCFTGFAADSRLFKVVSR
eukprot:963101-Prymnesium_polylepis.1